MNDSNVSEKEIVYDYRDAEGKLIYQVVRCPGKKFFIRHVSVNGEYINGLGDKIPVLYHLPELLDGIKNSKTVFICEGEKDADNLASWELISITCPMGAGKWKDSYTASLQGCECSVVIADKDEPGRAHARDVANNLSHEGINVKIIELPDKNDCVVKDFTDWKDAGGTKEELIAAINDAVEWEPVSEQSSEYEKLVDEYGNTYYIKDNGVGSVNQRFWAACHARENIELFEPDEKKFFRYDETSGLYGVPKNTIFQHTDAQ